MRDHPKSEGSSLPDRNALLDAYYQLHDQHLHHLLPLESELPAELQPDSRDKYRTIMTMTLSSGTGDKRLSECLGRLFKLYLNFDSLRNLEKDQVERLVGSINNGGIGLGDPRGGNTARLCAVLSCYFGPWDGTITPANTQALVIKEGFGPKIVRLFEAYCWGNKDVFPLDQPAFRALRTVVLYKNGNNIDKVRSDVEAKLAGEKDVVLIDFHEMLRFIEQSSGKSDKKQQDIIIGWNAWRILCSTQRAKITEDWICKHLIKDEALAKELWHFYRRISNQ